MPSLNVSFCISSVLAALILTIVQGNQPSKQPDPPSKASFGLKGYRRFHANDSLVGKPISCTHKEKVCFRYNVLYFSEMDRCLPFADYPCEFAGDKDEFFHGSGHLFAKCPQYSDPCPGYRMAYDNRCYSKEMVRDVICGCDIEPTSHILGGMECRCSPRTPIRVEQPEEDGKCLIPDLLFADDRGSFRNSPLHSIEWDGNAIFNCSADQNHCFSMGKVWMKEGPGCFPLKERGPCPAEHLVVLDGQAALQGRAEGVCAHQRGRCPQGQRRMAFDQRCYHDADLELIRQGQLYLSEFGDTVTTESFQSKSELSLFNLRSNHGNNECMIYRRSGAHSYSYGVVHSPSPPCGTNDHNKCNLYETESQSSKPLI